MTPAGHTDPASASTGWLMEGNWARLMQEVETELRRDGMERIDPPRLAGRECALQSRLLVIGWCLWLLGCLVTTWVLMPAEQPSWIMARWVTLGAAVGMLVIWPAVRLSQAHRFGPGDDRGRANRFRIAQYLVILDWLSLNIILGCVTGLFWLMDGWTIDGWTWEQALLITGLCAGWSAAAGAVIAWGRAQESGLSRSLAMLVCLLLLAGEPLLIAGAAWLQGLGGDGSTTSAWKPGLNLLTPLWEVTIMPTRWQAGMFHRFIEPLALSLLLAASGWMALRWLSRLGGRAAVGGSTQTA